MLPPQKFSIARARSCVATSGVNDVTCSRHGSVAAFGTTWHKGQIWEQVVSHDGSYLKTVLRYKFLILDIYHPGALCLLEYGCGDP
jgi:hypothetical protein